MFNTEKTTPRPWYVVSGAIQTANNVPIANMDREPGNGTEPVERDNNAKLIVSAVNMTDNLEGKLKDALMNDPEIWMRFDYHERNEAITNMVARLLDRIKRAR